MKLKEAVKALELIVPTKRVPFLSSIPGMGKSTIVKEYAKKHKMNLVDIRLSQIEGFDLQGLIGHKDDRLVYYPPANIPLSTDKKAEPTLIFLDEVLHADESVQKAAFKLVYDRMIGDIPIHKDTYLVAASNPVMENMGVIQMNSAFNNRFIHLNIDALTSKEWLEWAYANKIHPFITGFIHSQPDMLNTFGVDTDPEKPFASPRSWEMLSDVLKRGELDSLMENIVIGTVGEMAGVAFNATIKYLNKLPSEDVILANPEKALIPESEHQYAMVGILSTMVLTNKNPNKILKKIHKYIERLDKDIQFFIYLAITGSNIKMFKNKIIKKWVNKNSKLLIWD